jgi:hypothetical protein
LLNNLIIYNYNIGYIVSLIPNNTIINIYDNDTGLLGYALRELQYNTNYIRSSKCPLHCVLITSFENKTNSTTDNSTINIHFISTHNDYKLIDYNKKNIIFSTDLYYNTIKSNNITVYLIKN